MNINAAFTYVVAKRDNVNDSLKDSVNDSVTITLKTKSQGKSRKT